LPSAVVPVGTHRAHKPTDFITGAIDRRNDARQPDHQKAEANQQARKNFMERPHADPEYRDTAGHEQSR
jgi:hypothetical protein